MEVITGVEAPEYLRGPYVGEESIVGAITKNVATPIRITRGKTQRLSHVQTKIQQKLRIIINGWRKTTRMLS